MRSRYFSTAHFIDCLLGIVSGKMTELSDIRAEIGIKCRQSYLTYQIVAFEVRFLLTKWAIFYSIDVLETNIYIGLLFKLCWKNRGLRWL